MGLNKDYYFQSMSNKYSSTDYFVHKLHYWNVSLFKLGICSLTFHGPGSSVGIATELRAGWSGDRIPVGARFSAPVQTSSGAHPAFCTMGTRSFLGVKYGRGVLLITHPLLVPCHGRVELYLYPPSGPQ
jgi:hypothetical protein